MTVTPTPKLGAYAGLAALGLLAALALELPELVALAAPFLLTLTIGLGFAAAPDVEVRVDVSHERLLEGDDVVVTLSVAAGRATDRLEVLVPLPPGLALAEGTNASAVRLTTEDERELGFTCRCERWGAYLVGDVLLRTYDRFGVLRYEQQLDRREPVKVYPRPEPLRELLQPLETQVFSGNRVAREKGEGIEFADLRPFVPGDRIRRVNWRASARRGELWVNEQHAERNADVVLFLDSFAEARRDGTSTLDLAVRATAGLADRYLRHKDRVGLVSFGGYLNWLFPGTGLVQLYRIVDSVLDTEIVLNYAWKDIDIIPVRTLPPQALVVALTPLLDERATRALLDLRSRGFDVAIVEVSPEPFAEPGRSDEDALAYRVWQLRREAVRARYQRAGVPVAVWREDAPLVEALEEVRGFRRFARHGRA